MGFTTRNLTLRHSHNVRMIKSKKKLGWTGHIPRMEEGRSALKILTDKPTGKRPLERPMHRL